MKKLVIATALLAGIMMIAPAAEAKCKCAKAPSKTVTACACVKCKAKKVKACASNYFYRAARGSWNCCQ